MGIKSFFGLSYSLAKAHFKLRNEGSFFGMFWYFLNPLFTFLILLFVFSQNLGKNIQDYPLYLLLGVIMFNFFQTVTTDSVRVVRDYRGLIKSINFSRESLVGSFVLRTLFSHIFEIIIFSGFLIFLGGSLKYFLIYPMILLLMSIFSFGISLILSALTVYFVDMESIWMLFSRLLWFATPVFYSLNSFNLAKINLLNPMYYFIESARQTMIYQNLVFNWTFFGMFFYSIIFLVLGLFIFKKLKRRFTELL